MTSIYLPFATHLVLPITSLVAPSFKKATHPPANPGLLPSHSPFHTVSHQVLGTLWYGHKAEQKCCLRSWETFIPQQTRFECLANARHWEHKGESKPVLAPEESLDLWKTGGPVWWASPFRGIFKSDVQASAQVECHQVTEGVGRHS